ncbi:MAG: hypothetical protein JSS75_07360 [Bacteroidetes bacterium]|nr:hypothetical protein [Bacteroidota bacterium]
MTTKPIDVISDAEPIAAIALETTSDSIVICFPDYFSKRTVLINGETIELDGKKLLQVSTIPEAYSISLTRRIAAYKNRQDESQEITEDMFDQAIGLLEKKANALKELSAESPAWLDADNEARKFRSKWEARYESIRMLRPFRFVKAYITPSGNPWIHPIWSLDRDSHMPLYQYIPNGNEILDTVAAEFGFLRVPHSIWSHDTKGRKYSNDPSTNDSLEYVKINDTHVFGRSYILPKNTSIGTLETCIAMHEKVMQTVRAAFKMADNSIRKSELTYPVLESKLRTMAAKRSHASMRQAILEFAEEIHQITN